MEDNLDYRAVAGNLQQRLAELVASYEGQLAMLKTSAEAKINELQGQLDAATAEPVKAGKK